ININTVWDPETFLAVSDPQPNGYFQEADLYDPANARTVWGRLIGQRTPALVQGGGPAPGDRPFLGLAAGPSQPDAQNPSGSGIDSTLLRTLDHSGDPNRFRLFQPPLPARD